MDDDAFSFCVYEQKHDCIIKVQGIVNKLKNR